MKTRSKMLALGTAALLAGAVGGIALAETPSPGGAGTPAMHMPGSTGVGPEMMGSAVADPTSELASLKQQLGITEAQGPAWDAYAKVVQDTAASLRTLHERTDMSAMHNGADAQAVMAQMHDQHRQAFQAVRTAAEQLVATLDDTQKQKAQEMLPGLASGGHGMMTQMGMMGMGSMR